MSWNPLTTLPLFCRQSWRPWCRFIFANFLSPARQFPQEGHLLGQNNGIQVKDKFMFVIVHFLSSQLRRAKSKMNKVVIWLKRIEDLKMWYLQSKDWNIFSLRFTDCESPRLKTFKFKFSLFTREIIELSEIFSCDFVPATDAGGEEIFFSLQTALEEMQISIRGRGWLVDRRWVVPVVTGRFRQKKCL